MNRTHRTACSAALLAILSGYSAALPAQLPSGHLVTSNFAFPSVYTGQGGLFFVDPVSAAVTPVSNLPCELTGACTSARTPWTGSDVVLHLPDTGQLLANGPNWVGQTVDAFLLDLNGSDVTAVQRYPLATYTTNSGLANPAAARLPDGRILLAIDSTSMGAPGPLAGAVLGILDPSLPPSDPAAVTALPVTSVPPGRTNGLAIDTNRGLAYLAMLTNSSTIIAVDIPGGGVARQIVQVPGGINCLTIEPDGMLLAGGMQSGAARLWRIDPNAGTYTTFPQAFGAGDSVNALTIDPVSGDLLLSVADNSIARLSPRTFSGQLSTVARPTPSGWGRVSGLDLAATLRSYGSPSGRGGRASWELAPNPGGAPANGSSTFTLTSRSEFQAPFSAWVVGFAPAAVTLPSLAIDLLVAPQLSVLIPNSAPATSSTLSLPIPSDPQLIGASVFVQCAHLTGSEAAVSSGLALTIE